MAVFAPIQMPQHGIDAFMSGLESSQKIFDSLMKNRKNPYEIELLKGQAEEAQGSAAKSKMIANLINHVMGGGGGGMFPMGDTGTGMNTSGSPMGSSQSSASSAPSGGSGNMGAARLMAGLLGIPQPPEHVIDNQVISTNPITGERSSFQAGETPEQKRKNEMHSKVSAKTLEDVNESYGAGQNIGDSLSGLDSIINNPAYSKIAGLKGQAMGFNPMGIPIGYAVQQGLASPEERELFGQANTYMGNLVSDFGRQFKGPFNTKIQGLVSSLKPNVGESIEIQKGKIRALQVLNQIGQKRLELISQYIENGMTPVAAMLKASQDIPFSKIEKHVKQVAKSPMTMTLNTGMAEPGGDYSQQQQGAAPQAQPQNAQHNYSDEQLQQMAQDAIAKGADPAAVQAEMAKLRGY